MARLITIKKAKDSADKEIQHALYETVSSFEIHRWEEATNTNRVVEEINYEGRADQHAARAMAMGALQSLHHQALHETHGDAWTDKHGITWYWAAGMGRYVTIPD